MESFVVKVWYERDVGETEIRRLTVPADVDSSFDHIKVKVSEVFANMEQDKFDMFWKDEEGDLVIFSSQDELDQAVNAVSGGPLKIVVKDTADRSNSPGTVTSPDDRPAGKGLKDKQTRRQRDIVDKDRRPPRWMRCREGMNERETTLSSDLLEDGANIIGKRFRSFGNGHRQWRRWGLARETHGQQEYPTGITNRQENYMSRDENKLVRPNCRRERRRQMHHQTEMGKTDCPPRLYPRWMARRAARQAVRETDSQDTDPQDTVPQCKTESCEGHLGWRRGFWRRRNNETSVDDASFSSCQRRRLRRMRQESIMRVHSGLISRKYPHSENHVHFQVAATAPSHFHKTDNIGDKQENVCPKSRCPVKDSLDEAMDGLGCKQRGIRRRNFVSRLFYVTSDTPDCSDDCRKLRFAQAPSRRCRRLSCKRKRDVKKFGEEIIPCPGDGELKKSSDPRGRLMTNYRLRVLRRLRRMRYLKSQAMSCHQGPLGRRCRGIRRQQTMAPRQVDCNKRSGKAFNRIFYAPLAPYHGFRRFYAGGKSVRLNARPFYTSKHTCGQTVLQPTLNKQVKELRRLVSMRNVLAEKGNSYLQVALRKRMMKRMMRQQSGVKAAHCRKSGHPKSVDVSCGQSRFFTTQLRRVHTMMPLHHEKRWKIRGFRQGRSSPWLYRRRSSLY